jgi:hypothetical protein
MRTRHFRRLSQAAIFGVSFSSVRPLVFNEGQTRRAGRTSRAARRFAPFAAAEGVSVSDLRNGSVTTFDRRPSQFAKDASKIFRLLRMASGLPTGERALDLSGQDSVGCSPLPAAMTASGFLQTSRSMSGNNQETIFDRKLV